MDSDEFPFEDLEKVAKLLDSNTGRIPAFCKRYILKCDDEWKLGNALAVLAWVKHDDPSMIDALMFVVNSSTLHAVYKSPALRALANHAGSLKPSFLREVHNQLPDDLVGDFSDSLLGALPSIDAEKQPPILGVALSGRYLEDPAEMRMFGTSIIDRASINEKLYVAALPKVKEPPHIPALLMMGLLNLKTPEYDRFEEKVKKLAAKDELTKWYYEKFLEIYCSGKYSTKSSFVTPAAIYLLRNLKNKSE